MSDIQTGDKLIVSAETGHLSRNPYLSRVGDVPGERLLLIHTPMSGGGFVRFPLGAKLTLIFYTSRGVLSSGGVVLEYTVQNSADLMKVELSGDLIRIQRRRFYRLDFSLEFTFVRSADLSGGKAAGDAPVHQGIIRNLSGGGMCFVSDALLAPGEHIVCRLSLNCPDITAEGMIRSAEKLESGGKRYLFRTEFVNLDPVQQEQIVRYIYYMQLEMIKKFNRETEAPKGG